MKDLKPIVEWTKSRGEAKIVDRILLKILPQMLQYDQKLTSDMLDELSEVWVAETLYDQFVATAEEIVGVRYE